MGKLSKSAVRSSVWDKTGGKCWYCGKQTTPWKNFCIDHFTPKSNGGSDELENLVPSCYVCNSSKKDLSAEDYRKKIQYGNIRFSDKQIKFITSNGGVMPKCDKYIFFFERKNK